MVRHLVLIKPGDEGVVNTVLAGMGDLVGVVPGLRSVETGRGAAGGTHGYTRYFILDLDRVEGLRIWDEHPVHGPIRDTLLAHSEMLVFDYEVDG